MGKPAKDEINPKDLKNFNPLEQLIAVKFLQSNDDKNVIDKEYLDVIERNNRIIQDLAARVESFQSVGPTPSGNYLRKKLKKIEDKLLKEHEDERRFDEMIDIFLFNLQSTLSTLPFIKHRQHAEEIQYKQNNDYIAQLKAANSMMHVMTYGKYGPPPNVPPPFARNSQQQQQQQQNNIGSFNGMRGSENYNVNGNGPMQGEMARNGGSRVNAFLLNANMMLSKGNLNGNKTSDFYRQSRG
jgi:hypothetical protein